MTARQGLGSWPWANSTEVCPLLDRTGGEGNGTPLQYSRLENPMDGGAWWAAVHAVAMSWIQLSDFTFTFHFYALEKEMATHSSVLAWRIPGTAEPGGLPPMELYRVRHDWSSLAAAADRTGAWGPGPFLSEHRITFLWWRFMGTSLPDYGLTSRTKDVWHLEAYNSPCLSLTFPRKGLCWKLLGSFRFLRHDPPHLLAWPSVNLSLFQTLMFWSHLASLCNGHMDLHFGSSLNLDSARTYLYISKACFFLIFHFVLITY